MTKEMKEPAVMYDRGTQIYGLPSSGLEVGEHVWFGEPRNVEAVVMDYVDTHRDGVTAPRCEVLPEYLPRRGWVGGPWKCGGERGYSGFTTPLVGENLAEGVL